jgi:hypothetical protein
LFIADVTKARYISKMHFPVNIPLGKSYIPVHFVCETLAYIIGYRYYSYLRKKKP